MVSTAEGGGGRDGHKKAQKTQKGNSGATVLSHIE
ncbi:hypothetical protein EV701_14716 [Chthoniobacter flavus]|nr:hypothetical protein EV701_14716 [Chthoniobacter flavus]